MDGMTDEEYLGGVRTYAVVAGECPAAPAGSIVYAFPHVGRPKRRAGVAGPRRRVPFACRAPAARAAAKNAERRTPRRDPNAPRFLMGSWIRAAQPRPAPAPPAMP